MKKHLLAMLSLCIAAFGATSASAAVVKAVRTQHAATAKAAAFDETLNTSVAAIYDDQAYETPNYYIVISNNSQTKFDRNTGTITSPNGSLVMILDLYNEPTNPHVLPTGTYKMQDDVNGYGAFTFNSEYSMVNAYGNNNQAESFIITDPIEISCENDIYTISTVIREGNESIRIGYVGRLPMNSVEERPTVYPQITYDVNATLDKGGISFYQGTTDVSYQGVSYLNLYSTEFDENGSMQGNGWNLCMLIAHKRFTTAKAYTLIPGEYVNATNLQRFTWYPCREIDYPLGEQTITMPFGSYIRRLVNGEYTYAYLKTGTFTIEELGDGNYRGTLTAVTDLGFDVNVTWEGPVTMNTENATFEATVSNLTDDVDLDFSKLETSRVWYTGLTGGCRTFKLDIGSPAGRDEGINYGGDLLRIEFLAPTNHCRIEPGIYRVVLRRWNSNELNAGGTYEPYSLNKGYFSNSGDTDGTYYRHFKEGAYCVYDLAGPIDDGQVKVTTTDYENYNIEIALVDDAGFEIRGTWDGPVQLMYDYDALVSGIESVEADHGGIQTVVEGRDIVVLNAGNAPVALYNTLGSLMLSTTADSPINASALPAGVYILKVSNTSFKIALK